MKAQLVQGQVSISPLSHWMASPRRSGHAPIAFMGGGIPRGTNAQDRGAWPTSLISQGHPAPSMQRDDGLSTLDQR